jgi:hypothetical protein
MIKYISRARVVLYDSETQSSSIRQKDEVTTSEVIALGNSI